LGAIFGSKYAVPNPTATADQAILGDIGNLANLYTLGQGTAEANALSGQKGLETLIPGYDQQVATQSANVSQELSGQVPLDVQQQLQEQAAERGVASGFGTDSPNSTAAYLRGLGLTSLNMEQLGQQGLQTEIGESPTGQPFNVSSMFVSPEQEQAAMLASAEEAAAPEPAAAGITAMMSEQMETMEGSM
jgi:hypothetical protein